MKYIVNFLVILLIFIGCSTKEYVKIQSLPKTNLVCTEFENLPDWEDEDYDLALRGFKDSCKSGRTKKIYKDLCSKAENVEDAREFFISNFLPFEIHTQEGEEEGLLTGYYEPYLRGSLTKHDQYIYPVYETPKDLITVDLSSIYPDLKHYRLRGRLQDNKIVPYYTRKESSKDVIEADVICYVDNKIDLFFLEVQGSGRVLLDNNETIFIGYDNQNGHKYKSIGKYLVDKGEIPLENISLQSIRKWFRENPDRVEEVLNYNDSLVFFKQKEQPATGSLGLELTPRRSIAVDKRYIPLGSMLYCSAEQNATKFSHIVQAQDTGGAIKGEIRADMFLGFGDDARSVAGRLKAPLKLWIFLPKGDM
ncbi:transglycosylase [Sulfurimonas lithotrophica]|uniref:peptidoglycan lytic exotransglycosylase n=1 Tax=Sulfurimonas lithotrophica TaxID=2590022 RepID=A0A5P8P1C4_9BACT|nr:murein transglycosylase A [Sulfurimonas lithotrophica]QFR49499.1 transglycosylase [Sulfurimonas lithotrophica]